MTTGGLAKEKGTNCGYEARPARQERRGYGQGQGRMKEAGGALSGDRSKKSEGRSDQRKGTAKEKKGNLKDLLK
jgi:uncharacterized protein YjbJ (UPF0337 family)